MILTKDTSYDVTIFCYNKNEQLIKKQFGRSMKSRRYYIDTLFYNNFGQLDSIITYGNDFFNTGQINTGNNLAKLSKKVYRYYNKDIKIKPHEVQEYIFYNNKWVYSRIINTRWENDKILYEDIKIPIYGYRAESCMMAKSRTIYKYDKNGTLIEYIKKNYSIGNDGKKEFDNSIEEVYKKPFLRKNWTKSKTKKYYYVRDLYAQPKRIKVGKTYRARFRTVTKYY